LTGVTGTMHAALKLRRPGRDIVGLAISTIVVVLVQI